MPTAQQLRERLVNLLKDLFQLNQPDLDFGFYRIMHAKSKQVAEFLDKDLLKIVEDAFGKQDASRRTELEQAYQRAIQQAKEFGAPEPEKAPGVVKAKAALDAAADIAGAEADVYDHLYRFFERYYDGGDFLSRRYLSAETGSKAAAFAVPYDGREVYLHWANADQYYIKTSEYFTNFTFDPTQAREVQESKGSLLDGKDLPPLKVHFRVIEATEGEHGNVKASEQQKRFFLLHAADPVAVENGELVVHFEFRPDPEKSGQEGTWQAKQNEQAVAGILSALDKVADPVARQYAAVLRAPAPTEKQKDRPVLAKYVAQYTARNTMDYFIHKNLGAFLRREMDFYIKNEVMRLDDIDSAEAPAVETYLAKVKVLRAIAQKIIAFLAQLENFQKKLWLKKKFVVETNWCITLDRIIAIEDAKLRDSLLKEIAANDAQREEWVRLFAINEIKKDLHSPGYSKPLTVEFLRANPLLALDTALFDEPAKARLLSAIDNLDEMTSGLLVNSENLQAIKFLTARYAQQVRCIYIDPPFNLGENADYLYRVDYKNSTWLSLIGNRLDVVQPMVDKNGGVFVRCSHDGNMLVRLLLEALFGQQNYRNEIIVRRAEESKGDLNKQFETTRSITVNYDNIYWFSLYSDARFGRFMKPTNEKQAKAHWHGFWKAEDRPNMRYEILGVDLTKHYGQWMWCKERAFKAVENYRQYEESAKKTHEALEQYWECTGKTLEFVKREGTGIAAVKYWIPPRTEVMADNNWLDVKGYANKWGFKTENSEPLLRRIMDGVTSPGDIVFDFFLGSGTTTAAAHKMQRRWLGVEMGAQFDSVILPRMKTVLFGDESGISEDVGWAGGGMFKYIRLEDYEDALNNLAFAEDAERDKALAASAGLRQDYVLHYMLDVETRGGQSLLNIDAFADPTAYALKVKKPGSDEYVWKNVDLIETFNYLIGLRVEHMAAPQVFTAKFKREKDPELPKDTNTRLVVDGWAEDKKGRVNVGTFKQDDKGPWWFRRIEGWVPTGNGGGREKVLIIWRRLTADMEQDNLMLDCYFQAHRLSTQDWEFDTIYVNGTNNLPNLKRDADTWKVRLIEEDFHRLMWDVEDV